MEQEARQELRVLVETYYDCQKVRIESGNRVGAAGRRGLSEARQQALQDWVDERQHRQEAELQAMVLKLIRHEPIWEQWMKGVSGVGPCIAGGLIAWADPTLFDTVSKLWKYAGLHVNGDGNAARRQKGEKSCWNAALKTLCWKAGTSFVRVGKGYRELYEHEKARLQMLHPEPVPYDPPRQKRDGLPLLRYSPLHIENMARRHTVKVFLAHYWETSRKLAGLPTREVYVVEKLGHTSVIPVVMK